MAFSCFYKSKKNTAIQLTIIPVKKFKAWLETASTEIQNRVQSELFHASSGQFLKLSDKEGNLSQVIWCVEADDMWALATLCDHLPALEYKIEDPFECIDSELYYLGFGLGAYQFHSYKSQKAKKQMKLFLPSEYAQVEKTLRAVYLTRDMINTPAEDMGPADIAHQAQKLAQTFSAKFSETIGKDLIKAGYPGIYTVGRASTREPRLIQLSWGKEEHPHVVLIGKGVAFDTGGLDIKAASGMRLMHKDMGGAANTLGLARLIMDKELPIRLTVMIPAVDNAISGDAYRPSDIITMGDGTTVEVSNTDAEGRLILADVLHHSSHLNPDMMLDFATLTGAARVAVGTEMAAFFCNDKKLTKHLNEAADKTQDPIWQMPLFPQYKKLLNSHVADLKNAATVPYAGSISAALFLEHFVKKGTSWAHFDLMGWNVSNLPGRAIGGEAMGIRAAYQMLEEKYKH